MIQRFRKTNFKPESRARIVQAEAILEDYPGQKLTARQLYYQFVARGLLENNQKNLTGLLADARYAGLIDWEAIEDRGREPSIPLQFADIRDRVDSALANYRLPRWEGQKSYVELWVEKQALAGVLAPIAREYHATLMVNKGYSSASAMYDAAQRYIEEMHEGGREGLRDWEERCNAEMGEMEKDDPEYKATLKRYSDEYVKLRTKQPILLYLGDHDPSGEDMVRDIGDRLREFGVRGIEVVKIALTMTQIRQYNPPPNPAKVTDPRATAYIQKYGESSWEVDALPPNVLTGLIRAAFDAVVDKKVMQKVIAQEEKDKARLKKAAEAL